VRTLRFVVTAILISAGLAHAADAPPTVTRDTVAQALAAGQSLAGMDLSGAVLPGMEFASADLSHTKWAQADLRGARFTQCNLEGADFTGAAFNGATFRSCRLTNAVFTDATLPGAYLGACDLSGALFDKTDTFGATLVDLTLFPTGASHVPAIGAAIQLRGGPRLSPAWLAGASGDAFAFTYDRQDRAAWPGAPLTFNPAVLALDTLGWDALYKTGIGSSDGAGKEITGVLRRGLVAIVPVRLAGGGLRGNAVEGAVWVAAYELGSEGKTPEQISLQTPFGPAKLALDDFLSRWEGPWPTLYPAGAGAFLAKYPICEVGAQKAETTPAAVALAAFRHASAIMKEPRSFGVAFGGFDAYRALIADAADANVDIGELIHWSGAPRRELAASRRLAAAFCREAAPKLPPRAQAPTLEAAMWYDEIAALLSDEWPLPAPEAFEGQNAALAVDAATTRRPHAKSLLEEALIREGRAVALLAQAVAEAVKAS